MRKKSILFIIIFAVLGLIALQIPFTQLVGSKVKFTLFDFFGPIATGFIGTVPGLIAVALMQAANFLLHGAQVVDAGTVIRFFPMLGAAWYFGAKSRWQIILPLAAMLAFIAHPIGRTAWVYSLYWLVPVVCYFLRGRFLLARALGATFTAHAIGGALWIYAFNLPAAVWLGLIPVVAVERSLFALGIAGMYVVMSNVLNFLMAKKVIKASLPLERKYLLNF